MLREIKEIKLREINYELDKYRQVEEEYVAVERQIAELENQKGQHRGLLPYRRFNWLERNITQRREYKKYKAEDKEIQDVIGPLEERVAELREKRHDLSTQKLQNGGIQWKLKHEFEKIQEAKTLEALGYTFQTARQRLEENNIPVVLREEDKYENENASDYNGLENFILVHKTRVPPSQDRIKSSKELSNITKETITIDGVEYEYSFVRERDTVHFTVNNELSSHVYGQGDDTKYAILIPFVDVPKSQIGMATPMDTFTRGGVNLTSNSWILCPEGESEEIKRQNPEASIIGYEGESVKGYSAALLSAIGYKLEDIGLWAWENEESNERYKAIMEKEGLGIDAHGDSEVKDDEEMSESINRVVAIFDTIRRNRLVKNEEDVAHIYGEIQKRSFPTFDGILYSAKGAKDRGLPTLYERLEAIGIKVPEVYRTIIRNIPGEEVDGEGIRIDDIIPGDMDLSETNPTIIENLKLSLEGYNNRDKVGYVGKEVKNISDIGSEIIQRSVLAEIEKTRGKENRTEDKITGENPETEGR